MDSLYGVRWHIRHLVFVLFCFLLYHILRTFSSFLTVFVKAACQQRVVQPVSPFLYVSVHGWLRRYHQWYGRCRPLYHQTACWGFPQSAAVADRNSFAQLDQAFFSGMRQAVHSEQHVKIGFEKRGGSMVDALAQNSTPDCFCLRHALRLKHGRSASCLKALPRTPCFCASSYSLHPPPAAVVLVAFKSRYHLWQRLIEKGIPNGIPFSMELITGFEPVTSSLPRTHSTSWAISAAILFFATALL